MLVLLFFGVNLFLSFATDTYFTFAMGFEYSALDMTTRNGRPIIGLIYQLKYLIGLSDISFYYISSVLALIFLGISIFIYQRILEKYEIKENVRILLAFAGIANIFIIEYFMFLEKCGFMLAILFDVIGVYWIEKFFSTRDKKSFFLCTLFITLAIFTYQGTIALFVILSIPFAMKQAKDFKQYLLNGVALGIVYLIPALIDLLAFKFVFDGSRIATEVNYIEKIENVILGIYRYGQETFHILPNYVYLLISVIIFVALVIGAVAGNRKVWRIFNAFIIIIASCVFSTATILQGSGGFAVRIVYPLASIAATLAIDIFVNGSEIQQICIKKCTQYISMISICVLLAFQYFAFNRIYINKYQVNALDEYRYQFIYQAISEYQESTGTEVTKIAFYRDAEESNPQYSDLYCEGDLVVSALTRDWSDTRAMNYYLHTNYERISPTEEYTKYFSQKNWNSLSEEQLIFDGDTLHVCVY